MKTFKDSGYNDFTLNSTGLGSESTRGFLKSIRNWIINLFGGWTQEQVEWYVRWVKICILERPDPEHDPKLTIMHKKD